MVMSEETVKNAMDLNTTMAVTEIAEDMGIPVSEALAGFLSSNTGKLLYDEASKLWWDGPSAIAEAYEREVGWI